MNMNVAVIGITHPHTALYLETLEIVDPVDRIVLWDPDPSAIEKGRLIKSSKPIDVKHTLDDVLADPQTGAALVLLPNVDIPPCARRCHEAGKHVLIEKPGARRAEELLPVINAARASATVLSISYPRRFDPVSCAVRDMIDDGLLGRITSFEIRVLTSQVKFRDPGSWLFSREKAGGGILSWLGCHSLDLMRFLLRDEIVEVTGMNGIRSGEKIDVEDTGSYVAQFARGAIGTIRTGYHLPVSQAGYVGGTYDSYLCLNGTDGYVRWDPSGTQPDTISVQSVHPSWSDNPSRTLQYPTQKMQGYGGYTGWKLIDSFLKAGSGQGEPPTSGQDALRVLKIVDAAYRSCAEKKTITIDYGET